MVSSLSSFEIRHLQKELQDLSGAKIEKIFEQTPPQHDFLISLHVPSVGKTYLYTTLPKALCKTTFKPSFPDTPPAFCASLRRKITGARIVSITQQGFERIVVITLSTKHGESRLILELFSAGNMILVDSENKILAVLDKKIWNEDRKLLPGKIYSFPPPQANIPELSISEFSELLSNSTKDTTVTFLAIDCGLGGTYAEQVMSYTDIDKNTSPKEVDAKALLKAVRQLFELPSMPSSKDGKLFPITIEGSEPLESFNDALADQLLSHLEKQEISLANKDQKERLSKFEKVLKSQQQVQSGLEQAQAQNQEKGELIYSHYQELNDLLIKIKEMKKSHSWKEIKEAFKDHPLKVKIDEHKGTVEVNIS